MAIEHLDNYRETAVLIAVSTPDVAEEKTMIIILLTQVSLV